MQRDTGDVGEIAGLRLLEPGESRNGGRAGGRIETGALVIDEEEELVFLDRAAEGAAELVPAQQWPAKTAEIVRPFVCVQLVVSKEFKQVAMELVRAGSWC